MMRSIKSSELRQGMTILTNGMHVKLDRPIRTYQDAYGPVFHSRGLITNYDEVVADDPGMRHIIGISDLDNPPDLAGPEHRWTIQGNDNARWTVLEEGYPRHYWVGVPTEKLKDCVREVEAKLPGDETLQPIMDDMRGEIAHREGRTLCTCAPDHCAICIDEFGHLPTEE